MLQKTHPKVGIIGGTHGTGAQFASLLKKQGFKVQVSGRKTKTTNGQLAKESDILIFAPPLLNSVEIIKKTISHCTKKDQLILDVCSLKTNQMRAMSRAAGQVIGMHPLFGSFFKKVRGQNIILCPANRKYLSELTGLLRTLGLRVHLMSSEAHDQLMATIQVIPHLNALISGNLFRELNIHPELSLELCSPIYKTELLMIGRIYAQNPELYSAILAQNPLSKTIAQKLMNIVSNAAIEIAHGNVDLLTKTFKLNQKHFGAFAQKALVQSQKIIRNLSLP